MNGSRLSFFESISGIEYPEMIVDFFDHFIALKQIVANGGKVTVLSHDNNSVTFSLKLSSNKSMQQTINAIRSSGGTIVVYGRTILIDVDSSNLTDLDLVIRLTDQ